ncbi:hypothetical protein BCR43DRAFT_521198 [Syncephalastrum racemosum]|uniref:Transcriptional regulatory protein RXT2 N-terminal domain-containing protein n=1 Tax=Syncephalastrum racemosum TaxID=13706 RepID=A0A1X2HL26_SYNRA|nr:hypothetical protein BCR43DRAFT_521198 [Syncephalastrum racemosum]
MDRSNAPKSPPVTKWVQDQEKMDTDEVGLVAHNRGNKLRAPRALANEEEYNEGGKSRTVVKRRRRFLDDEVSDGGEDDPYMQINIEEILSPIEVPTDIMRRPALKRIIKSPQIEGLANTAMEFIEGEKNFNKILSRLSAILHKDDPQYLDLTFERTPEERKRYKIDHSKPKEEEQEQENDDQQNSKQASSSSSSSPSSSSPAQQQTGQQEEQEPSVKKEEKTGDVDMLHASDDDETGPDLEAQELVRTVRELLLENINFSNEYLSRLQGARDKLTKAHMQKDALYKQLKANMLKESDRRRMRHA